MGSLRLSQLRDKLRAMSFHFACVAIDGAFFGLWALLQWGLTCLTTFASEQLSTVNTYTWTVLEIVFAVSTIVPVVIYTWYDLMAIWRTVSDEYSARGTRYAGR